MRSRGLYASAVPRRRAPCVRHGAGKRFIDNARNAPLDSFVPTHQAMRISAMGVLDGMVAMVTGAASRRGIGHGIVLAMAEAGADIVVTDIGRRSLVARAEPEEWRG